VRIQRLSEDLKKCYGTRYKSAQGLFDIYVLFIERGITWLQKNGKLGFITSNKFVQSDYGKGIRKVILEKCAIECLIDFGDTGVFSEVTNYPCIFVLERMDSE
jgi:predicted helicase